MLIINNRFLSVYDYNFLIVIENKNEMENEAHIRFPEEREETLERRMNAYLPLMRRIPEREGKRCVW